jgi:3-deoxy-7-phosphoheptulonate synthase
MLLRPPTATTGQNEARAARMFPDGRTPHATPGATPPDLCATSESVASRDPGCAIADAEGAGSGLSEYRLASRTVHPGPTTVCVAGACIGSGFTVVAGPCAVEDEKMIVESARFLRGLGIRLMRAGAFKPRSSPYAFQGLGAEGLRLLARARRETGIGIVTEVLDTADVEQVADVADIVQVGSRNMQNYALLRRLGRIHKPVLLKRGLAATLEEWLLAAEYVLSGGNSQVILCERGVRTFVGHTRNTLDLAVVPALKRASHLPVLVDPSHSTGKSEYVAPLSRAALAVGADGLLIEVHPDPRRALSDGRQSLDFRAFQRLYESLVWLGAALSRDPP